ncbi:exocyst complex component 3 [Nematocida sp. AWRm77]|nr:exocyst complex component 3 [Nematocida sp. AWRm77]
MRKDALFLLLRETESLENRIQETKKNIEKAKISVETAQEKLSSLPALKDMELVKSAATAQENLERIAHLMGEIKLFDTKYSTLSKYIKKSTDEKTTKYLLSLYKAVKDIEGLKDATPSITEKVTGLADAFNILLFTLVDELVAVVRTKPLTEFLKIVKIVDREEQSTSGYREKMFETFLESIERKFREHLGEGSSALITAASLEFILEDIRALKKTESAGLPEKYKVFSFAAVHYHRALYEYLNTHADSFDPNEAMGILLWVKHYYNTMKKLGKPQGSLGPVLFSGKEAGLTEKYVKAAEEKLTQWIDNLAQAEAKRFHEKKKAPDLDSSNKFISIGFMDLLHIIKQQIEPVYEHEEIFKRISKHILKCVENFRHVLTSAVEKDLLLVLQDKSQSGFEEYTIAVGNSGLKFMDCLQSLPCYQHSTVQAIGGVFYACFLSANAALSKNILFVLKPALKCLFTKKWIEEPASETIVSTLKDYLTDYKETMVEYSFTLFCGLLLQSLGQAYVDRMCKKHAVFLKEHLKILSSDRKKYHTFFSTYLSRDMLAENLRYFDLFLSVVTTDNLSLCTSELKAFHTAFPKESKERVKTILKRMPGGGKTFAAEVLSRAGMF